MPGLDLNINLPDGENLVPGPEKVEAMHALLEDVPFHLGRSSSDRDAWEPWKAHRLGKHWISEARRFSEEPIERVTNELYARCYQADSRAVYNDVHREYHARLKAFLFAECLDPTGANLPTLAKEVDESSKLITWVNPAHDQERENFDGKTIEIDLGSAQWAMFFSSMDFLLGDRLPESTRQLIRTEIDRRVFDPFRQRIETGMDVYWWIPCTHNWNTVCVACILGCALWLKSDRWERAWYLALADDLIQYSNKGLGKEGFYNEGLSYWNYGFGNYVVIAETVRAATGYSIDWLHDPIPKKAALYGVRTEVQNGLYPTFADSQMESAPGSWVRNWINNRIETDPDRVRTTDTPIDAFDSIERQSVSMLLLNMFHTVEGPEAFRLHYDLPRREWYEEDQFLICRPNQAGADGLAATFIGGHNGVNHNHNDLGTFTVALNGRYLICDPGLEIYTNRTFSKDRYLSNLLNSYGHPVPIVAGRLQSPGPGEHRPGFGSDYRASIVDADFSVDMDRIVMDLTKAYEVDSLVKLERTFSYLRSAPGRVDITDHVAFTRPESFESALITYANWRVDADGSILISDRDVTVRATIQADGDDLLFEHGVIHESATPTRLAWRIREPVTTAMVRISVVPA
jgi:hypothetical protein